MPSRNSGFRLALRLAGMTMRKVIVILRRANPGFLLSWGSFDLALEVESASQKLERCNPVVRIELSSNGPSESIGC